MAHEGVLCAARMLVASLASATWRKTFAACHLTTRLC